MEIIKLEDKNNYIFDKICDWYYNYWGIKNNESMEEVKCTFSYSLNNKKLPQTFVALIDQVPVGMYQIAITDDLNSRPDIYPRLINVYVDEKHRGKGICKELMNSVYENAKNIGLTELYLYTKHIGLYEKFGWEFQELVKTFKEESPIERLYKLKIKL